MESGLKDLLGIINKYDRWLSQELVNEQYARSNTTERYKVLKECRDMLQNIIA